MEEAKEGKLSAKEAEKIHKEALKRFELVRNDPEKKKQVEDLLFLASDSGQWTDKLLEKRKDRPRCTVDRISGPKDQVIGNQRQTRRGVHIVPKNGGTKEIAKIYTGLIRDIDQTEAATNIYDSAFDEQLTCGYGAWRYLTKLDEATLDQVITMEPIDSACSAHFWDPTAKKYDKRDSRWQFLISHITKELFTELYPNASITDFDVDVYREGEYSHWFSDSGIRIAEYWRRVPEKKTIVRLSDGRVIDKDEDGAILDELEEEGITVELEKEIDSFRVEMAVMNGAELLTGLQPWAGKYIPIVPVFGKTQVVNSKTYTWGIVRKAKDAQRNYNYATSAVLEATALTPKDPVIMSDTQIAGHEPEWATFNTENPPVLTYKSVQGDPPPYRLGAPLLQQSLIQQVQQAKEDIYSTTGIEPAGLSEVRDLQSGVAKDRESERGDKGTFVYRDNLEKSQRFGGEILLDLIPRYYDTQRVVKVIGEDEEVEDITINEIRIDEETGEEITVNDLSQGAYGVLIKSGPAFATKREQTVDQLIRLAEFSPDDAAALTDLIVDNMDLNKGEIASKRIRKRMIDQGLIEPTDEEIKEYGLDQGPAPDPMQQALVENVQIQTEKLIAEIKAKEADIQEKIMETQKKAMDSLVAFEKELRERITAGLPVDEQDLDVLEGQQALVLETQEDVLENQEIAGSLPMDAKGLPLPEEPLPGPQGPQGPAMPGPDVIGGMNDINNT